MNRVGICDKTLEYTMSELKKNYDTIKKELKDLQNKYDRLVNKTPRYAITSIKRERAESFYTKEELIDKIVDNYKPRWIDLQDKYHDGLLTLRSPDVIRTSIAQIYDLDMSYYKDDKKYNVAFVYEWYYDYHGDGHDILEYKFNNCNKLETCQKTIQDMEDYLVYDKDVICLDKIVLPTQYGRDETILIISYDGYMNVENKYRKRHRYCY